VHSLLLMQKMQALFLRARTHHRPQRFLDNKKRIERLVESLAGVLSKTGLPETTDSDHTSFLDGETILSRPDFGTI
jgi:hypothetical protein